MNIKLIFTAAYLVLLSSCASTTQGTLTGGSVLDNSDRIVDKLQAGGYVIYFSHGKTDWQQQDSDRANLADCSRQRKLSDKGQAQSRQIGKAFSMLKIPVAQVLASPYCRCLNTGELVFGYASNTFDLKSLVGTERQESTRRVNVLKNMLATTPPLNMNTVLISHSDNILNAADYSINEGDAVIFKPMEEQGFEMVAYITSDQWMEMARTLNMHRVSVE